MDNSGSMSQITCKNIMLSFRSTDLDGGSSSPAPSLSKRRCWFSSMVLLNSTLWLCSTSSLGILAAAVAPVADPVDLYSTSSYSAHQPVLEPPQPPSDAAEALASAETTYSGGRLLMAGVQRLRSSPVDESVSTASSTPRDEQEPWSIEILEQEWLAEDFSGTFYEAISRAASRRPARGFAECLPEDCKALNLNDFVEVGGR